MQKNELRILYKEKRKKLSSEEVKLSSQAICEKILKLVTVGAVHCFLPIEKFKEVDTWPLIYEWIKNSEIQVVCSVSNFEDGSLKHVLINEQTKFKTSAFGIPEPTNGSTANIQDINQVIIPLLCCDLQGNRIGYGKGFYDRFLSQCAPNTLKIGVSYFEPIPEITDSNDLDIP